MEPCIHKRICSQKGRVTRQAHQICMNPELGEPHVQQQLEVPGKILESLAGVKYHWCKILKPFSRRATFDINLKVKEHKELQSSSDNHLLLIMVSHLPLGPTSTKIIDNNKA